MQRVLLIGAAGYVGSYLTGELAERTPWAIDTCDVRELANGEIPTYCIRHQDIPTSELGKYSTILFFAGVSSVPQATSDPSAALAENCVDLLGLVERLLPTQRLIYASSASVYSHPALVAGSHTIQLSSESAPLARPMNPYDASKSAFDMAVPLLGKATTGLRMGTVCGYSPRLRPELVFNSMVIDSSRRAQVSVRNGHAWRALLFLGDLLELVIALVATDGPLPTTLNAGSVNITIGHLANRLAQFFDASLRELPDTSTYSFALDFSVARSIAPVRDLSIEEQAELFISQFRTSCGES